MRYQETNIAFFLTFLLLLILMIFAISHTLKRTRIEKQSQRQNVYTFFSTVFWGILHSTIIILFFLAMRKKKYLIFNVLRFVLIFAFNGQKTKLKYTGRLTFQKSFLPFYSQEWQCFKVQTRETPNCGERCSYPQIHSNT